MKVLILGGDGYLGWPTAMHLADSGHEVLASDNYLRRDIMRNQGVEPLYETPIFVERAKVWSQYSKNEIRVSVGDLRDWDYISKLIKNFQPDCIVHYAEQPSAPFSMLDRVSANLTLLNNLTVTSNLIFAVKEFSQHSHIVKLGTMGEYGTPNIDIEEGWLSVEHKGRNQKFLYPRQAGSLYHTTKIMDTDLLWFYVRVWGLKVTDLMQGPVYGIFTNESYLDERLLTNFSYDELFGTVLNRFIVQAIAEIPLTVYGAGGQTRGYLNIKDTLNCIKLAVENPASDGEMRILNQFTETFSVNDLAKKVCYAARNIGIDCSIQNIPNPRIELEEHYYNPANSNLINLGLEPNYLSENVILEMLRFVQDHKIRINHGQIYNNTKWRK